MMNICVLTIVDSIAWTSMPVNEFVIYRSRHTYGFKQILISCSSVIPDEVDIPSDVTVYLVGNDRSKMRHVLKDVKKECSENHEKLVVHLHAQKSAMLFYSAAIGLGINNKTVFTIHSTYSSRDIKYRLTSCVCSLLSEYANCVSYASYQEYSSIVKRLKGKRMLTIQNGVDYDRIQVAIEQLPAHSEVFNIHKMACVGRMIPIKNQRFLVKLMKHLPDTELVLIGQEDDDMIDLIKEVGVEDRVTMTGLLPRDEVFRILNGCGIYVSASLVEGMPVSVLEAMSVGLIPVISDIAPHKEVAQSCLLFNSLPLVENDWIQTIQTYQQLNEGELRRLSLQLKNTVRSNFSLEKMHEQYNEIYKLLS